MFGRRGNTQKTIFHCSSFFVIVYASPPYVTTGLISVLHGRILVALDKNMYKLLGNKGERV